MKFNQLLKWLRKKTLINNLVDLSSSSVLVVGLGFLYSLFLARTLTPENLGHYFLLITFYSVIERVFNPNTWQAYVFFHESKNNKELLATNLTSIDIYSYFFGAVIFFLSSKLIFNETPSYILALGSLSLLSHFFDFSLGVMRVKNHYKSLGATLVTPVASRLGLSLIMVFFLSFKGPNDFLCIYFISVIVQSGYKFIYCKVNNLKLRIHFKTKIEYVKYCFINSLNQTTRVVLRQTDVFLVEFFLGTLAVGLLKIMKDFSNLLTQLTEPIYQVLFPYFRAKRFLENNKTAKKATLILLLTSCVCYTIFLITGEMIITTLLGDSYSQAFTELIHYLIPSFLTVVTLPLLAILMSTGHHTQYLLIQLISISIGIMVWAFTISYFGLMGLTFGYLVQKIIEIFFCVQIIKKTTK